MSERKVLITTVPFGDISRRPFELLEATPGVGYVINPLGRKLNEPELAEMIVDVEALIAGTEPITRHVMTSSRKLKLISRVGIGLDNVDLLAARELGIEVLYTPESPSAAVAELTIGHMLNLLRHLPACDRKMRRGVWQRSTGERLANQVVGIVGVGRIGSRVLRHLQGFSPKQILVNDIDPNFELYRQFNAMYVEKHTLYRDSNMISLHVPLTRLTRDLISAQEFSMMERSTRIINTSRGGIVNEAYLYTALKTGQIAAAAVDVFETEPYTGNLAELDNCLLSCHMGSMTSDCRAEMELRATEGVVRFVCGDSLQSVVPQEEYDNQL